MHKMQRGVELVKCYESHSEEVFYNTKINLLSLWEAQWQVFFFFFFHLFSFVCVPAKGLKITFTHGRGPLAQVGEEPATERTYKLLH